MTVADDDKHRELAIAALSPEMQAVMAMHALSGLRFVYFGTNIEHRRWKALRDGQEMHTASTLYVLLSILGRPQ